MKSDEALPYSHPKYFHYLNLRDLQLIIVQNEKAMSLIILILIAFSRWFFSNVSLFCCLPLHFHIFIILLLYGMFNFIQVQDIDLMIQVRVIITETNNLIVFCTKPLKHTWQGEINKNTWPKHACKQQDGNVKIHQSIYQSFITISCSLPSCLVFHIGTNLRDANTNSRKARGQFSEHAKALSHCNIGLETLITPSNTIKSTGLVQDSQQSSTKPNDPVTLNSVFKFRKKQLWSNRLSKPSKFQTWYAAVAGLFDVQKKDSRFRPSRFAKRKKKKELFHLYGPYTCLY